MNVKINTDKPGLIIRGIMLILTGFFYSIGKYGNIFDAKELFVWTCIYILSMILLFTFLKNTNIVRHRLILVLLILGLVLGMVTINMY